MNRVMAERIENVMDHIEKDIAAGRSITAKINRLVDQRNALQKLINVLDEERTRLEKPHLKGENIDGK